jgi:hypothetical protein
MADVMVSERHTRVHRGVCSSRAIVPHMLTRMPTPMRVATRRRRWRTHQKQGRLLTPPQKDRACVTLPTNPSSKPSITTPSPHRPRPPARAPHCSSAGQCTYGTSLTFSATGHSLNFALKSTWTPCLALECAHFTSLRWVFRNLPAPHTHFSIAPWPQPAHQHGHHVHPSAMRQADSTVVASSRLRAVCNEAAREILAPIEILSEISRLPSASPPPSTEQSDNGGDVGVGFLAESFLQPGESARCPAVMLACGARVVRIAHGEEGPRHRGLAPTPTRMPEGMWWWCVRWVDRGSCHRVPPIWFSYS